MLGCHLRTRSSLVCAGLFLGTFLPLFFFFIPSPTSTPCLLSDLPGCRLRYASFPLMHSHPAVNGASLLLTCPSFTLESSRYAVTQEVVFKKKRRLPVCVHVCVYPFSSRLLSDLGSRGKRVNPLPLPLPLSILPLASSFALSQVTKHE